MKKSMLIILLMATVVIVKAQQPQTPQLFHNQLEYIQYLSEHPESVPQKALELRNDYTLKLDSVVGSNDFDWTRWKNVYAYTDEMTEEMSYEWQNQVWVPTAKTETFADQVKTYRWVEEDWQPYQIVTYQYITCGGTSLVESMTTERFDSVWVGVNHSTYEYDADCNLLLNMNYNGKNEEGEWRESSKYEYTYSNGMLDTTLYSTVRNGNWNESQRDIYTYDAQNQLVSLLVQNKFGGWGPFGNNWMDSYRYEFEYQDGELVSELLYAGGGWGWFGGGGELELYSKVEYEFDANGNLLTKTTNVTNDRDWIVYDVYENRYDLTVDAEKVLGLASVWKATVDLGMGFESGDALPLNNQWLSCSIVSYNLDTEFTLYCSGFAAVDELQVTGFKAYSSEGRLVVENADLSDVTVYDVLGRVVASKTNAQQCEFALNPGLYLVSNGKNVVKAIVK